MKPAALLSTLVLLSGACSAAPTTTAIATTTTTVASSTREQVEPDGFSVVLMDWHDGSKTETLEVYLADNNGRRRRGLMGVTTLGEFDGMAFVWDSLHEGGFWMKDTLIPLDIAFVDADGEVIAVMTMQPCEEEPCPSVGPDVAYLFAFESIPGDFEIKVGDTLSLDGASR